MPKQRQTCTRCSQRRQKCDRKSPCTRCVLNNEGALCTTKWVHGYNPSIHRKYPKRQDLQGQERSSHSPASPGKTPSSLDPPLQNLTKNVSPWSLQPSGEQSMSSSHMLPQTATSVSNRAQSQALTPSSVEKYPAGEDKLLDVSIVAILSDKDSPAQDPGFLNQNARYTQTSQPLISAPEGFSTCYSSVARVAEIRHLQSILPSKENVFRIIDYYEQYMQYWMIGTYHGPSFRRELKQAYGLSDELRLHELDWRWTALLFAILSSGLIGCPEDVSASWGFSIDDKVRYSREWGVATVACLNLGNYTSQHHIYSVQAIYIMHTYEHLTGSTHQWLALRSVALVIAKGLGLNKLGPHPDDERIFDLTAEQKQAFIDREVGRRTWYTITTQDWLITASRNDSDLTIHKDHFTTSRPRPFNEETLALTDDFTPTFAHVGNFFFDNAFAMLDFSNAKDAVKDEDDTTRYALILKYDGDYRASHAADIPPCLSSRLPANPAWPCWAKWARRVCQASSNHQIIQIHQGFLNKSFKEPRYMYSKWACINAAKATLELYTTREPNEPQWWVEQVFVVTAGMCLAIILFHRADRDEEIQEHYVCVQKAIAYLRLFPTSSVAAHGIRILASLMERYTKMVAEAQLIAHTSSHARPPATSVSGIPPEVSLVGAAGERTTTTLPLASQMPLPEDAAVPFHFDADMLGFDFEDIMCNVQDSLDYNPFFDSMLSLATGQHS